MRIFAFFLILAVLSLAISPLASSRRTRVSVSVDTEGEQHHEGGINHEEHDKAMSMLKNMQWFDYVSHVDPIVEESASSLYDVDSVNSHGSSTTIHFESCQRNSPLTITSAIATPALPARVGVPLNIVVSGSSTTTITSGRVHLRASKFGIFGQTFDSQLPSSTLPIHNGPFSISYGFTPNRHFGMSVSCTAKFYDQSNRQVACIEFDLDV